ncbi:MAG: hypothetical protein ABL995_04035 [Bryobacteraceae bacterium]
MVRREIEIDEATDQVLTELASEYHGNLGQALADLVYGRAGVESFAEGSEAALAERLRMMRNTAENDFRAGRGIAWEDVKSRNGL